MPLAMLHTSNSALKRVSERPKRRRKKKTETGEQAGRQASEQNANWPSFFEAVPFSVQGKSFLVVQCTRYSSS